jgi:hypothetical protein
VSDALSQCQRRPAQRQTPLGVSEQPIYLPAEAARAHSGVVSAIKQAMGAVPLRIIEPAPCLAVVAGNCRRAGKHRGRPGAVVRL